MENGRNILIYLSIFFKGDWDLIYDELKKRRISKKDIENANINYDEIKAITIIDEDYPKCFKTIEKPPFVLFYRGNKELLTTSGHRYLSVVGSRNSSMYGETVTKKIISNLSKDTVIVSGLARGIDTKAHKEAINASLPTIAFLGGGIDLIYPKENEELYNDIVKHNGLILSEYPFKEDPKKENFLFRNRLIAGISKCTLLVESKSRSGAYNTACYASVFGNNVACIPSSALEESNTNKLIKEGAYLVENALDLKDLY